jgi:hypothetical protein
MKTMLIVIVALFGALVSTTESARAQTMFQAQGAIMQAEEAQTEANDANPDAEQTLTTNNYNAAYQKLLGLLSMYCMGAEPQNVVMAQAALAAALQSIDSGETEETNGDTQYENGECSLSAAQSAFSSMNYPSAYDNAVEAVDYFTSSDDDTSALEYYNKASGYYMQAQTFIDEANTLMGQ